MNREIKFRGKMLDSDDFVYGYYIHSELPNEIFEHKIYCADVNRLIDVKEETVGQFTGFHDRFGNEIYESDIVYVRSEDENAIIEWDEQTARFIIHFDGWIADFDNYYGKELEIMGDIYNNPELLGGE